MAASVIGLHIGAQSIRAVEVQSSAKAQPVIRRFHEVSLPYGAAKDSEVLDPALVSVALKLLWKEAGFKSRNVVLGIGNQRVLVRDLTMPKLPARELQSSLGYQVESQLPVPLSEALLDFYPIEEVPGSNGNEISGLLVVAVKEIVEANVNALKQAGLRALSVDLNSFAITRLYNLDSKENERVVLIHIGATTTHVVVVKNRIPVYVRIIPLGGDSITDFLKQNMAISWLEADALKMRHGVALHPEEALSPDVRHTLNKSGVLILNALRSTQDFYVSQYGPLNPDRILLSGGGSKTIGLAELIQNYLQAPTEFLDTVGKFRIGPAVAEASLVKKAPDLAIPLGLALGGDS